MHPISNCIPDVIEATVGSLDSIIREWLLGPRRDLPSVDLVRLDFAKLCGYDSGPANPNPNDARVLDMPVVLSSEVGLHS